VVFGLGGLGRMVTDDGGEERGRKRRRGNEASARTRRPCGKQWNEGRRAMVVLVRGWRNGVGREGRSEWVNEGGVKRGGWRLE
jgi:hypothetical protein